MLIYKVRVGEPSFILPVSVILAKDESGNRLFCQYMMRPPGAARKTGI
jgi:hypothetical protein